MRSKALRQVGLIRLAAAMTCALMLASCGGGDKAETAPEPGDRAVARVNGHPVWSSDVKREAVAQGLIGEGEPLDVSSDLFRRVLDEVVDQKLLATEAVKRKIDKDPLAQRRLAGARERILGDMLVEGTVEKAVNENAIRGLYQETLKLSKQSEEVRLRQVVTATLPDAEAVKKVLSGGGSFEAVAMERSTDAATRFKGGDLGYATLDILPAAYAEAVKTAKVGQLVGPIRIETGFAVVKIEDRRQEAPITLEAARPQIVRFLTYDQVRSLIDDLRGAAKVETLIPKAQEVPGAPREPAGAKPGAAPPTPAPETP